jgi:DNA replication protein DnaC
MDGGTSRDGTGTTSTINAEPSPCKVCGKYDTYCNGTGFYDLDVPVGHPDFSKVFRCPNNPLADDDRRKETLRKLSNLGAFSGASFDNFDLNRSVMSESAYQSLRRAYNEAIRYAEASEGRWMVIEGAYGSGKTHLAAAIGNRRLEAGDLVLFVTAPDLLDHLRGGYAANADESYNELFDRVRRADLLILDDLGVENPSEWSREKLFQLLNHRYIEQLATVVTTNVSVDSLDPRLRSRMLDMSRVSYVRITAPDYRSIHTNAQQRLSDLHLYDAYTLDNFDVRHGCHPQEQQNLTRALQTAHEFVQGGRGWLVLIGNSGTGKTHLAAGIGNHWQRSGGDVMFATAPDLLDDLRKTFGAGSHVTFDEQFQQVKEAPLLVLDDLGAVDHNKAWVREKLLQVIKHRYIRKLPTIITTTQEFDEIDPQIRTRMLDSRLCHIFAITARPYVDRVQSR